MRSFLIFSMLYFVSAVAVSMIFSDASIMQTIAALAVFITFLTINKKAIIFLLGVAAVSYIGRSFNHSFLKSIFAALLATTLFNVSFTTMKTTMSLVSDFFADPFLARVDNALHFGIDPWKIAHEAVPVLDAQVVSFFYVEVWLLIAISFPMILVLFDKDEIRRDRYLLLYVFVWVGLGNIIAFAGLSAGPVYYDRIFGTERFASLTLTLQQSGISSSLTGFLHDKLWIDYSNGRQLLGSGISAFPSVHVAVAMLVSIYLSERHAAFIPIAIIYTSSILFLSIYLGWHYAVDGYFSIIVVAAAALLLRRSRFTVSE